MALIRKIEAKQKIQKLTNVAAYARVSSEKDSMHHSLSAQISYYSSLIQKNPGWTYAGVYSDEAVTGTKEIRKNFDRMVEDAKAGKIDIIITKSISRFARNTVTLLQTIRELKAINVDVYFEEQNIHTIGSDGELLITLLAGYAQEESRSCSENCLWRIKKNFTEGRMYGAKDIYGYKVVNNKYEIVPEQVELVKWVFDTFLSGIGTTVIARMLNEQNIPTIRGNVWRDQDIRRMLKNISYTGDLILQKTFTENHITKKKMINKGEKDKYYVEDDHAPIVSKETFYKVQAELMVRSNKWYKGTAKSKYPFTGMIRCKTCGSTLIHKIGKYRDYWLCCTADKMGANHCKSPQVRDDILKEKTCEALGITEFDEQVFKSKILWIDSFSDRTLVFHFKDGTEKMLKWENVSRSKSWTPEMKERARQKRYEQEAKKHG